MRDQVVWEVADALLSNPSLKIEAIALTIGFADAPSFAKAFKRHTGLSPTSYRERTHAGAPGRRIEISS